MTKSVLILGPSGRFGRHSAEAFANAGWAVRKFDRQSDVLAEAARDADVIVNAWNPQYDNWAEQVPQLHAAVIRIAKQTNATVIVPGNVYVFGQNPNAKLSENTRHNATNPLGKIRVDLEQSYLQAGIKTIILRAGDFIDTHPSGNWFDKVLTSRLARGVIVYPGAADRTHAWAYLPDLARAAVALCEMRDELPVFSDIPFPGYAMTGEDMCIVLSQMTGRQLQLKKMNWSLIRMVQPFWPVAKHLLEMRYLWNIPHRLDGKKFAELVPDFKSTSAQTALANAIGIQNSAA